MNRKAYNDLNTLLCEFANGTSSRAYEIMGCHKTKGGHIFRVWVPNAKGVYVVGSFNNWDTSACPMYITLKR